MEDPVQDEEDPTYLAKIVLIGDSGVGKTSLLSRYVDDVFSTSFVSTIGVDFKAKAVKVKGRNLKLMIWDTAGQERFRTITSSYYRGARGIMVVYDVTVPSSFDRVTKWIEEACKFVDGVAFAIVGNKADLDRKVSTEEGKELAQNQHSLYFETSANTGANVDEAFASLVEEILKTSRGLEIDESVRRLAPSTTDTCRCNTGGGGKGCAC
eukprot:jgi/Bigna1/51880/estExt_Genewise1Plus.C_40013